MKICPNCGWSNDSANRFCENCGADLEALSSRTPDQPDSWSQPRQIDTDRASQARIPWEIPPGDDQWSMAPLPPQDEPQQKRKRWVWIVMIGFLLCAALCAGSIAWLGYTDSGERFQTSVAENATEAADPE